MNVLIIDPDEARAAHVADGIRAEYAAQDTVIRQGAHFELRMLRDFDPDMVIIACESPDRDMLEALQVANEAVPRPVVMFVDRSDANATARALEAGVAAYIVDGYNPNRIASILTVAAHRFSLTQNLRKDLDKARADLAARKVIDRAKGILMASRGLSEDDAYKLLRKHAMDTGRPLQAVAADILAVSDLLKPGSAS
ncbi:ANTAR domain-containing protein [Asticcacaulis sp. EMRT-3]|uniref:ANTAR domain-containing response regulator n=1 Tax=Asticcacaulis sp. EMRT-3 TaxID=3040349 RepID=UPI0024AF2BC5|nr:ANTAR domain-containing protein [Asticcacaulis sp. EMRT-3]MDI7775344.1 ANTAR domain-containing protein [Asticcacaulis sp. EMRT-3]